ncbi:MAG: hypothetical protein QXG65_03840 [Thermoplasmata archaeon]
MASQCPKCGTAVEWTPGRITVVEGRCGQCDATYTILEGAEPLRSRPLTEGSGEDEGTGVLCRSCGGTVRFEAVEDGLTGTCVECGGVSRWVRPRSPMAPEGKAATPGEAEDGEAGVRSARPCRQCGGALRFSPRPDGSVVGTCARCGNRFTLRGDRPGRWGREGGRSAGGFGSGRPGGWNRPWSRGGRFGNRPGGPRGPPRGRRDRRGPPGEGSGRRPDRRQRRREAQSDEEE